MMNTIEIAAELLTAKGIEYTTETGNDWSGDWKALAIPAAKLRVWSSDTEAELTIGITDATGYPTGRNVAINYPDPTIIAATLDALLALVA